MARKKYTQVKQQVTKDSIENIEDKPVKKNNNIVFKYKLLTIFCFSFLLYSNTLFFDYTLDDQLMIYNNKFTKMGISGIKKILSTDSFVGFFGEQKELVAGGRYRPLSHIMFAVEWQNFGKNPFIGHLINVLLYSLLCVLLFYVLEDLFAKYKGKSSWYLSIPFIITMLFAAHPLHTEVVANIKGRDEILSLLGSLGTLFLLIKYSNTKNFIYLISSSIVYFLGLMSKENSITFLLVIPLAFYYFKDMKIKDTLFLTLPLIVPVILFLYIRYTALGFFMSGKQITELLNNPFIDPTKIPAAEYSTGMKYATIVYTMALYFKLLIFPHPLTHDYYPFQIPIIEFTDYRAIISILIYLFLIFWAIRGFFKKDIISWAIILYLATFSIASNLVFPIGTFMNERFMFASLLGYCIVFVILITNYLKKKITNQDNLNKAFIIVFGTVLTLYSIKTFTRNFVWYDDFTLFTTDVNTSTNSTKVNVSAGGMYLERAKITKDSLEKKQMLDKSIGYLTKAAGLYSKNDVVWLLLGNVYIELKDYPMSAYYLTNSLKVNNSYKDALHNMLYVAQVTNKEKQYDISKEAYKTLIHYQPNNYEHIIDLAMVYENAKQIDSALYFLNMTIAKDSLNYHAYSKIGELYGKYYGQLTTAIAYLNKAYSIKPDDSSINENLGVAYGISRNFDLSIKHLQEAIKLNPNNPQTYINMAGSYNNMGRKDLAQECMIKAQNIQKKGS